MAKRTTTTTPPATTTVTPQPAPAATTTVTLAQLHSLTRGQLMALGAQHGLKVRDTLPKPVIVDFLAQHLVTGHVPGSVTTSAAGKPAPLASSLPTKARVLAGLAAPPAGRAWHGARATTTTQPAPPPPPAPLASLLAALANGTIGKR
jgi:hypothetical protein